MGKVASDEMIDGGLDKIATCTSLTVCAGQPVSYADIATKALATVTINGADFTKANGDTNGRKVTVASQADIAIGTTGLADHVAIKDGTSGYYVTTCTGQTINSGGTVTTQAWDIEIADPV